MRQCRRLAWSVLGIVLLGCATEKTSVGKRRPEGSQWEMGTPIVSYYHGPGGAGGRWGPLTPGMAKKLKDGGFTMVWGSTVEDLDVAHAHGLRVLFETQGLFDHGPPDEAARFAVMDGIIDRVKDHPAMYAYAIADEPSAKRFPALARLVAHIRKRDPHHLARVNLFPTYASANALGTAGDTVAAYREHLRQFVEVVKPDLISWDHYNLRTTYDGGQYFLNMALVREAAVQAGIAFINVIQSCALSETHRIPTGDESRFLQFTTLAYGGVGVSHFVYWPYAEFKGGISEFTDSEFDAERGTADATAPLTPLGKALCEIHPEFVAVANQLQSLTSLGAYHLGVVPTGAARLPDEAVFTTSPPIPADEKHGILLGYFGATTKPTHVLVVNLDYTQEVNTTVVGPGSMEVFETESGTWLRGSARQPVVLKPGGGQLLRTK